MTNAMPKLADGLNRRLASLLSLGTWASCALIAIGMALPTFGVSALSSAHFISAGIVLLIALPTLRVIVMGAWFLRNRDVDFALIAALVLAIIVFSTLLGISAA
jgi:hypothetical protein